MSVTLTEWFYPTTAGVDMHAPDQSLDYASGVFNSVTGMYWGIAQEWPNGPGTDFLHKLFIVIDPTTGQATSLIDRPNYSVAIDPTGHPCPITYENVSRCDLLCDPVSDRIYLTAPARRSGATDFFSTWIWEWVASTGAYVRVSRPGAPGSGSPGTSSMHLNQQYNPYTGDIWHIIGYAASLGNQPTVNLAKWNKGTGLWSSTYTVTFQGLNPATTQRVSPARMLFLPDGTIYMISEPSAPFTTADISRSLYKFNPAGAGSTTVVATMDGTAGANEFFWDMYLDAGRNKIYLAGSSRPQSSVWTYDLSTHALTKMGQLPTPTDADLYSCNGWDKSFLPGLNYDQTRDLIWYAPNVNASLRVGHQSGQSIVAVKAMDLSQVYNVLLVSALDPPNIYYDAQSGSYGVPFFFLPSAVYASVTAYDNSVASTYGDQAGLLRMTFGIRRPTIRISSNIKRPPVCTTTKAISGVALASCAIAGNN